MGRKLPEADGLLTAKRRHAPSGLMAAFPPKLAVSRVSAFDPYLPLAERRLSNESRAFAGLRLAGPSRKSQELALERPVQR